MQIYLLRHAKAEHSHSGAADHERRLTAEGRHQLTPVIHAVKTAQMSPDVVLSSPYKRAMQTAELAAERLGYRSPILTANALTPDGDPESVWAEIRLHREANQILLASHEPLMSATLAYLLGCPHLAVEFPTATVARVDVSGLGPAPRGVLRWMITPKLAEGR